MRPKAAVCLRGAVSKKTTRYTYKDSIYTDIDEYINYKAVAASIKKHIVEANPDYDVDIFIHCWSYELESDISLLYQPKLAKFEDNRQYSSEIESKCQTPFDFGGISQALSIERVLKLKEKYEEDNSFTYDIVVLFRPDVIIWTDMIFSSYDLSYFYTDGHPDNNGDICFVMSSESSDLFKDLYISLSYGNKHVQHAWIKAYLIKYCISELRSDSLIPGVHFEVLRHIWQTSIRNNHITLDMLKIFGITPDDIVQKELY